MNYIPAIVQIVGLMPGIAAIVALVVKPIREKLFGLDDIREGQKCILRSEMLRIYYNAKDHDDRIRQHENENFELMYKAYKAMKGNSFIDKIHREVQKMEVIT